MKEFDGIVEQATEDELANAVGRANRTGLLCCPHTGVALAALEKLVGKGVIKPKDRVIVISTANGLKFTDFLLKYHADELEDVKSQNVFHPVELPADINIIRKTIHEKLSEQIPS